MLEHRRTTKADHSKTSSETIIKQPTAGRRSTISLSMDVSPKKEVGLRTQGLSFSFLSPFPLDLCIRSSDGSGDSFLAERRLAVLPPSRSNQQNQDAWHAHAKE